MGTVGTKDVPAYPPSYRRHNTFTNPPPPTPETWSDLPRRFEGALSEVFPSEIWITICSFVSRHDALNWHATCKSNYNIWWDWNSECDMHWTRRLTDQNLVHFINKIGHIKSLNLTRCLYLTSDLFLALPTLCPAIKELNLSMINNISDFSFIPKLEKLKRLYLAHGSVNRKAFTHFKNSKKLMILDLTDVHLHHTEHSTDVFTEESDTMEGMTQLKVVKMSHDVTSDRTIVQSLPSTLTVLHLSRNYIYIVGELARIKNLRAIFIEHIPSKNLIDLSQLYKIILNMSHVCNNCTFFVDGQLYQPHCDYPNFFPSNCRWPPNEDEIRQANLDPKTFEEIIPEKISRKVTEETEIET